MELGPSGSYGTTPAQIRQQLSPEEASQGQPVNAIQL